MKILDRTTVTENMSNTKTIQNFGTLLRVKPHKLGSVVQMKPELSVSNLTEALRNVYNNPKGTKNNFAPINSLAVEWEIDVNFIKKVRIVTAISGTGLGGAPVTIGLDEPYYDKNDTFALENRQQLFVIKKQKVGTNNWQYTVTLIGNDPSRAIDTTYGAAGRYTRFRSNYFPELSERGYTKFFSNTETHRNYISRHRASVDWSADFAIAEDVFISDGKAGKETIYKMNKKEKECMDTFLLARENSLLFSECNFDINGKCLLQDEKGRDIPMGDGIITQIKKVCDKFSFSNLSTDHFEDAMQAVVEKSSKSTGLTIPLICNDKFWQKFNKLMKNDLRFQGTDNAYLWSKDKGMVKVGATFNAYEFAGNTIIVMVDKALSIEYDDHAYAFMLDAGKDEVTGVPNIAMFTLDGSELISGNLNGLGGASGKESGDISTSIHGSSYHLIGYAGGVIFNPYRSVIMEEAVVSY